MASDSMVGMPQTQLGFHVQCTLDPEQSSEQYSRMSDLWLKQMIEDTSAEQYEEFYQRLVAAHPEVPQEKLDEMWAAAKPQLQNPAYMKYALDMRGPESDFFLRWLVWMGVMSPKALEMGHGYGCDLLGQWRLIPDEDPMRPWVDVPGFLDIRFRTQIAACYAADSRTIIDLGSGMFPMIRHAGLQLDPWQQYYSCDRNPEFTPEAVLGEELAEELPIEHFTGEVTDFVKAKMPELVGKADLVTMLGVATYMSDEALERTVPALLALLRNGGDLLMDVQINNWDLRRDILVFCWPLVKNGSGGMRLMSSEKEVQQKMQRIAEMAGARVEFETREPDDPNDVSAILCNFVKTAKGA